MIKSTSSLSASDVHAEDTFEFTLGTFSPLPGLEAEQLSSAKGPTWEVGSAYVSINNTRLRSRRVVLWFWPRALGSFHAFRSHTHSSISHHHLCLLHICVLRFLIFEVRSSPSPFVPVPRLTCILAHGRRPGLAFSKHPSRLPNPRQHRQLVR
jgi:hypothetical protein